MKRSRSAKAPNSSATSWALPVSDPYSMRTDLSRRLGLASPILRVDVELLLSPALAPPPKLYLLTSSPRSALGYTAAFSLQVQRRGIYMLIFIFIALRTERLELKGKLGIVSLHFTCHRRRRRHLHRPYHRLHHRSTVLHCNHRPYHRRHRRNHRP